MPSNNVYLLIMYPAPSGIRNPDRPARSLITVLIALSRLPRPNSISI